MFARQSYLYDIVLLCEIPSSDSFYSVISKSARIRNIPIACVVPSCDKKASLHDKVFSAEIFEDLLLCLLERHSLAAEKSRNTVVFMIDGDIEDFLALHFRTLQAKFAVHRLVPQLPASQLMKISEVCQAGGALIFSSVLCARQCSILPNIEFAIDTCVSARSCTIDGRMCIVPVQPSTESALAEAVDRASSASCYLRFCGFEVQASLRSQGLQLFDAVLRSDLATSGKIDQHLAGKIAAMFLECGVVEDISISSVFQSPDKSDISVPATSSPTEPRQPLLNLLLAVQRSLPLFGATAVQFCRRLCHCKYSGVVAQTGIVPLSPSTKLADLIPEMQHNDERRLCSFSTDQRSKIVSALHVKHDMTLHQLGLFEAIDCSPESLESDLQFPWNPQLSIAVALKALASFSPHTFQFESDERRRLRQLALTVLHRMGKLDEELQTCDERKMMQLFQLYLNSPRPLTYESVPGILPEELAADLYDPIQRQLDEALVLKSLALGSPLAEISTLSPRIHHAVTRLQHSAAANDGGITPIGFALACLPMHPSLSRFILRCAEQSMFVEGMIAAAIVSAGGPFWKTNVSTRDSANSPAISAAVSSVVDSIRESNAFSEDSAIPFTKLGRAIANIAPRFKDAVKRQLRRHPGVVFVGERSDLRVYFSPSLAEMPAHIHDVPAESAPDAFDFTKCVLVLANCIQQINSCHSEKQLHRDLVEQWSTQYNVERKTMAIILKTIKSWVHHMNSIDIVKFRTDFPDSFASAIDALQKHCDSSGIPYPPVSEISSASFMQNKSALVAAAVECMTEFVSKCVYTKSAGQVKCCVKFRDGAFGEVDTPPYMDSQECSCTAVSCFSLFDSAAVLSADLFIDSTLPVDSDTVVIPVPSAVISEMMMHKSFPSHPACIIRMISPQELSVFGPVESLHYATLEIKVLVQTIAKSLTSLPLVLPVNGYNLSFAHRYCFGPGLAVNDVLTPSQSNVLILTQVDRFLGSSSKKSALSLHALECCLGMAVAAKLQAASCFLQLPLSVYLDETFSAAQSLYDVIEDKSSIEAKEAKSNISTPVAYFEFGSFLDARAAHDYLSVEYPEQFQLPVEAAHSFQNETAFRVAFAVSNFVSSPLPDEFDDAHEAANLLPAIRFCGRTLYPVHVLCKNRSKWHVQQDCSPLFQNSVCCTHHVRRYNFLALKSKGRHQHWGAICDEPGEAVDGGSRMTVWCCCGQSSCDIIGVCADEQLKSSVFCNSPFEQVSRQCGDVSHSKHYRYCWERLYFASEREQLQASRHILAREFERQHGIHADREFNCRKKSTSSHTLELAPRSYSLEFPDSELKDAAIIRMTSSRRVPFQYGQHLQVKVVSCHSCSSFLIDSFCST
jgi:hypothetical protein